MGALNKCFYWYIFPTGNGCIGVSMVVFPVGKRNL